MVATLAAVRRPTRCIACGGATPPFLHYAAPGRVVAHHLCARCTGDPAHLAALLGALRGEVPGAAPIPPTAVRARRRRPSS